MQQALDPRPSYVAATVEGAAHAVVLLGVVALLVWFTLALRSGRVIESDTAGATTSDGPQAPAVSQPAAVVGRERPIIYVYGPPELAAALRTDLVAAMEGDSTDFEVIIDGLEGGQRKVYFIDLR